MPRSSPRRTSQSRDGCRHSRPHRPRLPGWPPPPDPFRPRRRPGAALIIAAITVLLLAGGAGAAITLLIGGGSRATRHTHPQVAPPGTVTADAPGVSKPRLLLSVKAEVGSGWPAGVAAFTVALASDRTEDDAHRAAAQAVGHGLPAVGALWSSEYSSLRPGYWFIFSGVYRSEAEAQEHVRAATAAGFRGAYPRWVAK